jgi:hypothetical protein
MVSRISKLEGLKSGLSYNEKKKGRGVADLIVAENFFKPPHKLSYEDMRRRFENRSYAMTVRKRKPFISR